MMTFGDIVRRAIELDRQINRKPAVMVADGGDSKSAVSLLPGKITYVREIRSVWDKREVYDGDFA